MGRIHVFHLVDGGRADDVVDADDVLVFEAQQDLYLTESALAVRLVLERADLLYGHAHFIIPIVRRTTGRNTVEARQALCYISNDNY